MSLGVYWFAPFIVCASANGNCLHVCAGVRGSPLIVSTVTFLMTWNIETQQISWVYKTNFAYTKLSGPVISDCISCIVAVLLSQYPHGWARSSVVSFQRLNAMHRTWCALMPSYLVNWAWIPMLPADRSYIAVILRMPSAHLHGGPKPLIIETSLTTTLHVELHAPGLAI